MNKDKHINLEYVNMLEIIIKTLMPKDNYHFVKRKWCIGRALSEQEVLLSHKKLFEERFLFEMGNYLAKKYGDDYSYLSLVEDYQFYNSHFNLFESCLDLDKELLPWESYQILMGIKNEALRRQMEKQAFLLNIHKDELYKMLTTAKLNQFNTT